MVAAELQTIDVYILGRMYDYAGHLIRVLHENPRHLTGFVLGYLDAEWKEALSEVVGHQGHLDRSNGPP